MTDTLNVLEAVDILELMKLLPHRYPFLLVDRIVDIDGDNSATGIKNVTVNGQCEVPPAGGPGRPRRHQGQEDQAARQYLALRL
jgi:hypothetical protein